MPTVPKTQKSVKTLVVCVIGCVLNERSDLRHNNFAQPLTQPKYSTELCFFWQFSINHSHVVVYGKLQNQVKIVPGGLCKRLCIDHKNHKFAQPLTQPKYSISLCFLAIFHKPQSCCGLWKIAKPSENCTWWSL